MIVSSMPIMSAGVLDKFAVFIIDLVHCRSHCMGFGSKHVQLLQGVTISGAIYSQALPVINFCPNLPLCAISAMGLRGVPCRRVPSTR
jgi:hypothetical protein